MQITPSLAQRAWEAVRQGVRDCWSSSLKIDARKYRLRHGNSRISQLLVLWITTYGKRPSGQLSNACGDTKCVNPAHYKDQEDREQAMWVRSIPHDIDDELLAMGLDGDDGFSYQVANDSNWCGDEQLNPSDAGMTKDFGCYHCGARFDPFSSRNQVVCDECWTDEDQSMKEAA